MTNQSKEERQSIYDTHSPRSSDSSLYDEVCIICGARGVDKLSTKSCKVGNLLVKITPEQREYCKELEKKGYRRVSNKHGMVVRIDRADWVDILAASMRRTVADFYMKDESDRIGSTWPNYYRRVHSKDTLTLDPPILARLVPTSDHDTTGYIPL